MKNIKAITTQDYFKLMEILEQKEQIIKSEKPMTIHIELNKIHNLKATITILFYTGAKIGEVQKMTVRNLKQIVSTRKFQNIVMTKKGIEELTKLLNFYKNEFEDNFIIRRYNKTSSISKNYLQTMTNLLLKELGDKHSTKGFKQNILNTYGITGVTNNVINRLGVTKIYAERLIREKKITFSKIDNF